MNLDFIHSSGAGPTVATVILVFFALLIIGAGLGFWITYKRERAYANTALPSLESEIEEEIEEDLEDVKDSAFSIEEIDDALDDAESNELMSDIGKAQQNVEKVIESQALRKDKIEKFSNMFKKKKKD